MLWDGPRFLACCSEVMSIVVRCWGGCVTAAIADVGGGPWTLVLLSVGFVCGGAAGAGATWDLHQIFLVGERLHL